MINRVSSLVVVLTLLSCTGEITPRPVFFRRDIVPIFEANCMACHWSSLVTGAEVLDVTDAAHLVNTLSGWKEKRPLVVPGKPDESFLLRKLTATDLVSADEGERMPYSYPQLDATQMANLRQWISNGARADDPLFDSRYDPALGYDGGVVSGTAPFDRNRVMYIFGVAIPGRRIGKCSLCHSPGTPSLPNLADPFEPDGGAMFFRMNGVQVIVPGDPDNSRLLHKVTTPLPEGVGRGMPLQTPYLTDGQINLVREWILQGAKDN